MKQAKLRALLTASALALSAPTPSSAQDSEQKSQEQRIQELEAQVAELQAEHDKPEPEVSGSGDLLHGRRLVGGSVYLLGPPADRVVPSP